MSLDLTFACRCATGCTRAPASALEDVTRRFASSLTLINERTGETADARSVLAIVGLARSTATPCRVVVAAPDEDAAIGAVRRFVEHLLPHGDDQAPASAACARRPRCPRC